MKPLQKPTTLSSAKLAADAQNAKDDNRMDRLQQAAIRFFEELADYAKNVKDENQMNPSDLRQHNLGVDLPDFEPEVPDEDKPIENEDEVIDAIENDPQYQGEDGAAAEAAVGEALGYLSDAEVESFKAYVDNEANRLLFAGPENPNEEVPRAGQKYSKYSQQITDRAKYIQQYLQNKSPQEQRAIKQRFELTMNMFDSYRGEMPLDVLSAIIAGTDFVNADRKRLIASGPIPLPPKTLKALEDVIVRLHAMPNATLWNNLIAATPLVGLNPVTGYVAMSVIILLFPMRNEYFLWDSFEDRVNMVNDLVNILKNGTKSGKLKSFFTYLRDIKYKGKELPKAVAARVARDAFTLMYDKTQSN